MNLLTMRCVRSSIFITSLGLIVNSLLTPLIGQEPKDPSFRGRLPAYYGDIVTEAQRQQIYAVQNI